MQTASDITTRVGGWLFRHRSAIPPPFAFAILTLPAGENWRSAAIVGAGVAITLVGELIRLWGVHHIGVISADAQRSSRTAHRQRPVRLRQKPALHRQHPAVDRLRADRAAGVAGADRPGAAGRRVSRDCAVGRRRSQEARDEYRQYMSRVPRWIPNVQHKGHKGERDRNPQCP